MAQLAFRWPGALVKQFENALDDYEQAGYDLEARFLMRCYVSIATGQSKFKFLGELWKKTPEELEEIWKKTKRAVDHTINFIKTNAGLESSYWIPSINALVPIVSFFASKQGHLASEEEQGVLFWFYEATIHGRFAASAETKIDQDLKAIRTENPIDILIANLRKDTPTLDITAEMVEGKYQRNPFLPLLFVISRNKGAKDWFTGTVLSSTHVGIDHQLALHHIFPKSLLKETGSFRSHEIDDLANIAFLSRKANTTILNSPPNTYLPKIEKERLEAQLVPLEENLWSIGRFKDFLKARRKLIVKAFNSYLQNLGQRYFAE